MYIFGPKKKEKKKKKSEKKKVKSILMNTWLPQALRYQAYSAGPFHG